MARREGAADHHALALFVHGIGEQPKGSDLKRAVEAFLPLIRKRLAEDEDVLVEVTPLDDRGPAEITFSFRDENKKECYELRFVEVWWAQAFHAPAFGLLLLGMFKWLWQWVSQRGMRPMNMFYFVWRLFWEALGRLMLNAAKIALTPVFLILFAVASTPRVLGVLVCLFWSWIARRVQSFIDRDRPAAEEPLVATGRFLSSAIQSPSRIRRLLSPVVRVRSIVRRFLSWFDGVLETAQGLLVEPLFQFQPAIVESVIIVSSPVLVVLATVLWVFSYPIPNTFLPSVFRGAHRSLVNLLTRQWGDMWIYLYQPWEASQIRMRFEDSLLRSIRKVRLRHGVEKLEAVMVIAHSMGSVVAYEGITEERIKRTIDETFKTRHRPRIHFVSVGSALNLCWDSAPKEEQTRFERPLSSIVDWLNCWTPYDPVGTQPLRLPPGAWQSRESAASPGYYVPLSERQVVNQMDLFSDHSAYWNNAEEVLAPLLNLLTGGNLIHSLRMNVRARARRVKFLATFKSAAWVVGPALLVISLWIPSIAPDDLAWAASALEWARAEVVDELEGLDWVIDLPSTWWHRILHPLLDPLSDGLTKLGNSVWDIIPPRPHTFLDDAFDWALPHNLSPLKSLALGIESGLLAGGFYSTVVKWAWDSWDKAVKYREP